MKVAFLTACLLLLSCGQHGAAPQARFHKISVAPVDATARQFIAEGQRVAIVFQNFSDAPAPEIDAFPEPPVRIRDKAKNTACDISEGGIWVRSEVYLSGDERYVLMNEYSGSGSDLVSYATHTCAEIKRLDVSGRRWHIDGGKVHFDESCPEHGRSKETSCGAIDLGVLTGKA